MFNAKEVKDQIVLWIREWFEQNGKDCRAVIGISGGIDSSVVAALCVEALGKDRVVGVQMPNKTQADISDADMLIDHLGIIETVLIDIHESVSNIVKEMLLNDLGVSEQTIINLPPRIRMSTLYAVSQSMNGRVVNTCNLSEDWVGWNTRYGDSVGDVSPLANLTKTEVKLIGRELGLPEALVNKTPIDGLCGKTDEDSFGFTYEVLDRYIRTGEIEDQSVKAKIDAMHEKNLFKLQPMPTFKLEEHEPAIVFPCKEGDDVFMVRDSVSGKSIRSGKVERFEMKHGNVLVITTLGMFNAREFGQTVFLNEADVQM